MYDYKRQFHISTTDLNAPVKKKKKKKTLRCLDCFRVLHLLCFGILKCTSSLNWPVCFSLCTSGKNVQFTQLSRLLSNASSSVLRNVSKKKKKKKVLSNATFSVLRNIKECKKENAPVV